MSSPRYDWWPYVKGMIRRYPKLKEQYADLHSASMTAAYNGMPHGTSPGDPTYNAAIRELPSTAQREYEAVSRAIATTERYRDGRKRLEIINLVLWKGTHTLEGAALRIPCSWRTAAQWHGEFIRLVASYYGLMDE